MSNIIADLTTAQHKAYSELAPNQKRKYTNLRKNDATHRVAIMAARKLEAITPEVKKPKAVAQKATPKGAPKTPKAPKVKKVSEINDPAQSPAEFFFNFVPQWVGQEHNYIDGISEALADFGQMVAYTTPRLKPWTGSEIDWTVPTDLNKFVTLTTNDNSTSVSTPMRYVVANNGGKVLARIYVQDNGEGQPVFTVQTPKGKKSDDPALRSHSLRAALTVVLNLMGAMVGNPDYVSEYRGFLLETAAEELADSRKRASKSVAPKRKKAPAAKTPAAKATKRRSELKAKAYGEASPESCELDEAPEVTRLKAALSKPVETMHCGICDDKRVVKGESSLQVPDVDGKPVTIRFRVLDCGHNQA